MQNLVVYLQPVDAPQQSLPGSFKRSSGGVTMPMVCKPFALDNRQQHWQGVRQYELETVRGRHEHMEHERLQGRHEVSEFEKVQGRTETLEVGGERMRGRQAEIYYETRPGGRHATHCSSGSYYQVMEEVAPEHHASSRLHAPPAEQEVQLRCYSGRGSRNVEMIEERRGEGRWDPQQQQPYYRGNGSKSGMAAMEHDHASHNTKRRSREELPGGPRRRHRDLDMDVDPR
jgi:hypothetical protein